MLIVSRRTGLIFGLASLLSFSPNTFAQSTAQDLGSKPDPNSLKRLQPYLDSPRLVGQSNFSYWGFDIYHASLWVGVNAFKAEQWQVQRLALELRYLRDFDGKAIAQRSLDEIQAQSALPKYKAQAWLGTLENLFPNVRKGQSLTGIYLPDMGAHFLIDNTRLGEIKDPELAKRFFDIWLAKQTSAPELRKKLIADTQN